MEMPTPLGRAAVALSILLVGAACAAPGPASPSASAEPSTPPLATPATTSPVASGSPSPSEPAVRVEAAAPMVRERMGFDSVLLGDGSVLAVGDDSACLPGPAEVGSETAERFDPATDAWTEADSLNKPRKSFATVALRDGRAMVLGGINTDDQPFSSTKFFDAGTGKWSDGPLLDQAIGEPSAIVLGDGKVMALRPYTYGETGYATAVELLDSASGAWKSAEKVEMSVSEVVTTTDGGALAAGGAFESPPLLYRYDPAADRWSPVPAPIEVVSSLDYGMFGRLVPLHDGSVLAVNVAPSSSDPFPSVRVSRLGPASGQWSTIAPMSTAREGAAITVLADGRVLVAGGASSDEMDPEARALASTEIFDPVSETWTAGPDLLEPRKDGHALVLEDGSVLIHGGDASFNVAGDVPWCPDPMTSTERVYLGS